MKQNKNSHHSVSNSLNKHNFVKNHNLSSNITTAQRAADTNKNKSSTKNILEMIYDDEFVIMINQLSTSIKNYYRANNKNFLTIKTILKNDINNQAINETFNKIENTFSIFYSSAKQIFKNMKIYRREKIANIMSHNRKKGDNNNMNVNNKQRNSDAKLKQLIKGDNESSNNLLNDKNFSINITHQNISNNINTSGNISNIMIISNNKSNSANNINKTNNSHMSDSQYSTIYLNDRNHNNKKINNNNVSDFAMDNTEDNANTTNYDEYFDVIKNISKKNVKKSAKKINESTDDNLNIHTHTKRGNSVNNSNSLIVNTLNKNDGKKYNKKINNITSTPLHNANNGKIMKMIGLESGTHKSIDLKKNKGEQISINEILMNDSMVNTDELNNIIKEKENIIINLKSNNIHLENKIKELENDNHSLKDKIDSIEKSIKEKDEKILEIKKEKDNMNLDNNNYLNQIDEILNEKKFNQLKIKIK